MNTLYIANDHAGYELKSSLINSLPQWNWKDLGTQSSESVDYPDYAQRLCLQLKNLPDDNFGVLICGSGQGMSMAANKFPHIRAALCWSTEIAELSRRHNNANVLCLGARFLNLETAQNILNTFLKTPFEGGRHLRRVEKINI